MATVGRRRDLAGVARSMAITSAEIRHTPLRRGLFGYKRPDVDDMLDEVVDAYQELWQERVDLRDQIEEMQVEVKRSGMHTHE